MILYDNKQFFNKYKELRENENNANDLEEKPEMLSLMPDLKGKRVLDLGCGYGNLCKTCVDLGAEYVKGVDISRLMLNEAEDNCVDYDNITFELLNLSNLDKLDGEKFDVVVSSLVMHYIEDFNKLCCDVHKLLNKDGIFLFSQEHPIFTANMNGVTWQTDIDNNVTNIVVDNYVNSGKRNVTWFINGVIKYHRTFSDIINPLINNGFMIEKTTEPTVSNELIKRYPALMRCKCVPDYLFVRAKKYN